MSKILNKCTVMLAALLMLLSCGMTAYGDAALDTGRLGSVTVTMQNSEGEAVPGGALTLYRVAKPVENDDSMGFAYTEAFSGCEEDLTNIESSALAKSLADYAAEHELQGFDESIGEDGKVKFSELPLGLYLLVQNKSAEGYEPVSPFLVTVPMNGDEGYIYDVDASPKTETAVKVSPSPSPTPTPSPSPTPGNNAAQTGQLNWPVPILAISGLLIFAIGWVMKRSAEKNGGNEA